MAEHIRGRIAKGSTFGDDDFNAVYDLHARLVGAGASALTIYEYEQIQKSSDVAQGIEALCAQGKLGQEAAQRLLESPEVLWAYRAAHSRRAQMS